MGQAANVRKSRGRVDMEGGDCKRVNGLNNNKNTTLFGEIEGDVVIAIYLFILEDVLFKYWQSVKNIAINTGGPPKRELIPDSYNNKTEFYI